MAVFGKSIIAKANDVLHNQSVLLSAQVSTLEFLMWFLIFNWRLTNFLDEHTTSKFGCPLSCECSSDTGPVPATKIGESAFVPKFFTPWNVTYQDCKHLIPYQTDEIIANNIRAKIALKIAFYKLESNSSIKFIEQTDEERYLYFTHGYGCRSRIGQQKKRGPQNITLGDGCLYYYTIIHEVDVLNHTVP